MSIWRSVCGKRKRVRMQRATDLKLCSQITADIHTLIGNENRLYRFSGCGSLHMNQISTLGSRTYRTIDLHQISDLGEIGAQDWIPPK